MVLPGFIGVRVKVYISLYHVEPRDQSELPSLFASPRNLQILVLFRFVVFWERPNGFPKNKYRSFVSKQGRQLAHTNPNEEK